MSANEFRAKRERMSNLQNRNQLRNQLRELHKLAQARTDQTPYEQELHQTILVMARQIDELSKDFYFLERKYQQLLQETQAYPLSNKQLPPSEPERNLIPPQDMEYWYEQAQSYEDLSPQELEQHRHAERVQPDQISLDDQDWERAQRYQAVSAEERARAEHYRDRQTWQSQANAEYARYLILMLLVMLIMVGYFVSLIFLG
jgi:hypothetical protein